MNADEAKTTVETTDDVTEEAVDSTDETTTDEALTDDAPSIDLGWDEEEEEEWETLAPLSERVLSLSPSATLEIEGKAKQLIAEGTDVIRFSTGELPNSTPEHIKEAGIKAIRDNETKYTPSAGMPELREAIAEKLERQNALYYGPDDVVVTAGAKHAIYTILQVLCDDGDEVLIPSPYWTSYPEQVKMTGAKPIIIKTDERHNWTIDPNDIERAVNSKTKAIILNTPNNPTGTVYSQEQLAPLVEILSDLDIYVISDEIYERLTFEGTQHISIAALSPEMIDRTIIINGLSKAYAMTGWRVGYAAGPPAVIETAQTLLSQSISCVSAVSQRAAIAALTGDHTEVRNMVLGLQERRDTLVKGLNDIKGITCEKPTGTFYAFARVDGLIGKTLDGTMIKNTVDLARMLLQHAQVAVIPGEAFGTPGYIRLSYTCETARVEEGLKRIATFVDSLG
jgi:aspartate aminotransferase